MARKLRYFEERRGRVEIIPMIDVMLFLLVFFIIVTLQMIPDAGQTLQLPTSSEADHLPRPEFTVNVQQDGSVAVKGQAMSLDQLTDMIKNDGNPEKTVITIASDKAAPFEAFVHVMDAVRKAGVTSLGVATQPGGAGSAPAAPAAPALPAGK
ncbi:MAG: biopolymer transporter ExbD [Acidibrevibacterium sp.]|jgi:biopolymer transport protein ExbD|uniref:ExbD/TolR family protein n=1 Tax=Acidibrevibacterium fodinaquatile TaxID=1969806 RepID=UPI000E0D5C76|nr:biopolymer transporter ExbD [Acidibrevibacterium fodinaquatile]MCA7121139.1 biopolymer transporter ExbD [Acidibrevibacterium fodinaquatile]